MDPQAQALIEVQAVKRQLVQRGGRLMLELIEVVRLFGILLGLYARLEKGVDPHEHET